MTSSVWGGATVTPGETSGVVYTSNLASSIPVFVDDYFNSLAANPLSFGVVGDGVVDDTAAMQFALDSGVRALYIPGTMNIKCSGLVVNNKMRIFGEGTLTAKDDLANLIRVAAAGSVIEGLTLTGTGNYQDSSAIASNDRICLIKVTGNNVTIKGCTLNSAYQTFIHIYQVNDCYVLYNTLNGGITTFGDTAYQGIRIDSGDRITVALNKIIASGSNKTQEAICFARNVGTMSGSVISHNTINGAHDHGIYVIGGINFVIEGNNTFTDGAGIVYTSENGWSGTWTDYAGASIVNNVCEDAGGAGGLIGIYLRDVNNTLCANNIIKNYATSIQMCPVTYDSINNRINNNRITGNVCSGFSAAGVLVSLNGLNLGQMINNAIDNNELTGTSTAITELGVSWFVGTVLAQHNSVVNNRIKDTGGPAIGAQAQEWFTVSRNKARNCSTAGTMDDVFQLSTCDQLQVQGNEIYLGGRHGIELTSCTNYQISQNKIVDVGTQANGTYSGIKLSNSDQGDITDNWIEAQNATANKIVSGIHGNNDSTGVRCWNNTVLRSTANLACQQMQQHTNSLRGNRTSFDPLTGTVTLAAAATTVVNNANVHTGSGVTSDVILIPTNAAAATLVSGANSPYISARVNATSFTIGTAGGGAAAGTETFTYELMQ